MILWITVAFGSCLSSSLPPLFSLWCMNQLLKYMLFTFYWYQGTKKLLVSHSVFLYISKGSYHIHTSVCDKNIKLWELHYNIIRNDFFNRDTLHSHVSVDVSIFLLQNVFLQTMSSYIPLKSLFNADQSFLGNYGLKCTVPRYRGSKSTTKLSLFRGLFCTFLGMH